MKNNLTFILNFLFHPRQNASLIPSSVLASKAMLEGINFSSVTSVVELGPGTGAFTKEVLKRCRPNTKILLIEVEESYIKILQEQFGDKVIIERASAHFMDAMLLKHHIEKVDLLISSLPFSLPENIREELFASIKKHTDSGTIFRFFTYTPSLMKRIYKNFSIREVSFVLRNIPPLWVYGIN